MFGGSMFGGMDQDPFFAMHQQQMQRMNQMMSMDPFGGLMGGRPAMQPQLEGARQPQSSRYGHGQVARQQQPGSMFGGDIFSHMNQMMSNMNSMMASMHTQMPMQHMQPPMLDGQQSGAPMYSHQSVMTYTNDGRGQPKVYQASTSTTNAGNGIREVKKTVRDSEQGIAKMAIDRQIGERRHCITKQKNLRSGDVEEENEFDNLDEEEAGAFHQEFQQRSHPAHPQRHRSLTGSQHRYSPQHRPSHTHRGLPRPRDH